MKSEAIKLNEEQIRYKRNQLEKLRIQIEETEIQIKDFERILELKLPERKTRAKLNEFRNQLDTTKRNIKILEKQVRNRQEIILKD